MYTLYDKVSNVKLPSGRIMTPSDISEDPAYRVLMTIPCAVDISGGILIGIYPMHVLRNTYGVDDEDDSVALTKINAKIEAEKNFSETNSRMASSVNRAVQIMALSFTDEQAIEVPDLYPEYEVGHEYKQNDRFQYNGSLYKVNQPHTSQAQWVPGEVGTESLYTNLMLNDAGYQIWKQPTGAHDAYNTGDVVEYKGTLYKSLIDGNAWAPDVYPAGWQEYDESTSTEPGTPDPGTETYPDFVQPTGAHDAYKKGDIVRYNGKLYQSLIDANAYSPDAYPQGWQEYSEE